MKLMLVAGARPNFVKIASIVKECQKFPEIDLCLVHTGQHYSISMSDMFFKELEIPEPDVNLEVGSASHAVQTAEIMKRFEPIVIEKRPDYVLVVGDVNSTIACALVAAKLGIKIVHVEAGLRSFDRTMPEEINRLVTDCLSDYLFVTEQSAIENLRKEGISEHKIHFVGNVMIDTLLKNRKKADQSDILKKLNIEPESYITTTIHRPSNVDNIEMLRNIICAFSYIQNEFPIIFPLHPRTRNNLIKYNLMDKIHDLKNIIIIDPLGYFDFLKLMACSKMVLTDSGGIQEETTILGVPCLTLRKNTERPVTITDGTNQLVGIESADIINGYKQAINYKGLRRNPPLWDGDSAGRIIETLLKESCVTD
jgi:UDP-N-acetylglucosamine 2-epimerase (non-hydrolysing)